MPDFPPLHLTLPDRNPPCSGAGPLHGGTERSDPHHCRDDSDRLDAPPLHRVPEKADSVSLTVEITGDLAFGETSRNARRDQEP